MPRQDHIDEDEAPVWSQETNVPYAKRTIFTFLLLAVVIAGGLYLAGFFTAITSDADERGGSTTSIEANVENVSGVDADGLADSMKEFFTNIGDTQDNVVTEMVEAQQTYDDPATAPDGYRHSMSSIRGSRVFGSDGDPAGEIDDIMVDMESGKARAVIVDKGGHAFSRDIVALNFDDVAKQAPDGAVRMVIDDDRLEAMQDFEYGRLEKRGYISLNDLEDGQLIDYKGKIVGQIDAVIYTNAEARTLYFRPRPTLRDEGLPDFYLPFEEANIIRNEDGFDVKLTKSQTAALARVLFPEER